MGGLDVFAEKSGSLMTFVVIRRAVMLWNKAMANASASFPAGKAPFCCPFWMKTFSAATASRTFSQIMPCTSISRAPDEDKAEALFGFGDLGKGPKFAAQRL